MSGNDDQLQSDFNIIGMTCGHCVAGVTKAISGIAGVKDVKVSLPGSAVVHWAAIPTADLISQLQLAVKQAGYEAVSASARHELSEPKQILLPELTVLQEPPSQKPAFPALNVISDSQPTPSFPALNLLDTKPVEIQADNHPELSGPESWELAVTGMHCASCVGRVEKALQGPSGVLQANVNLATERASVQVDPAVAELDKMRLAVRQAGYDIVKKEAGLSAADEADALRRERNQRVRGWQRRLAAGCILGLPLLVLAYGSHNATHMGTWNKLAMVGLSALTTALVGLPYFQGAWTLLKHGSTNMDTLVSLGSLVAFGYGSWMTLVPEHPQAHFLADGVIILIMITIGKWLEARSKGSAADALEGLMDLAPRRVTAVRASGREIEIDQADLKAGMLFRVKPGEGVATDGEVVEGSASVDESMLTGEAMPVHKTVNAIVIGGTRNLDGTLLVRATKIGSETVLQNIINAVKRAQSTKASVQTLVDKVASVFVPVVIALSIVTLLVWGLLLGRWADGVLASAAVLLISCPCALGLATPMAVAVASTRAARSGLIIRDAGVFERCDKLTYCMFDKTGTLTQGQPKVSQVYSVPGQMQSDEWLKLAATLENLSEHPLARAIAGAAEISPNATVTEFRNDRGHGVSGLITGRLVRVGSVKWLAGQGVALSEDTNRKIEEWSANAFSIAGVAIENQLAGLFAIEDTVRPGARAAVERLLRMELNVGVISGDRQAAVRSLAGRLHIPLDDIYAETTPEEKSNVLQRLRQSGSHVAMVGDGLNDAPALASADVSMAMASGTDVAMNAADIVIVGSELESVAEAIALSRATLTTIRHNLFWAFAYNVVAIPLAAAGVFQSNGPLIASVAMAGSSITVVLRSAWLGRMKWKT